MGVTRADVARAARTSTAVVSYVVNNGPRPVAEATRARVLRTIDELGYRPNRIAQTLRGSRSYALGLIVPDIANPFYAELSRAVEDVAFARGYTLIIGNTDQQQERELYYINSFFDRKIDGLFLIPSLNSDLNLEMLSRGGIPYVLLDRRGKGRPTGDVMLDNEQGGFLATTHLLEHGHRRIVCVAGPDDRSQRYVGYVRAMRAAGLEPAPCELAPFSRAAGYEVATRLLANPRTRPGAIFVCNDLLALGLFRGAADLGLRVPDDVAVVGFDGIIEGEYSVPRLTTIAQPIAEISICAVGRLVGLIEKDEAISRGTVKPIVPQLVVRESCGCRHLSAVPKRIGKRTKQV